MPLPSVWLLQEPHGLLRAPRPTAPAACCPSDPLPSQTHLYTQPTLACPALPCSGELMSYERCIFYTVLLSVVSLDRPTLKDKVGAAAAAAAGGARLPCCGALLPSCPVRGRGQAANGAAWGEGPGEECDAATLALSSPTPCLPPLVPLLSSFPSLPPGHRLSRGAERDRRPAPHAPLPLLPLRVQVRRVLQGECSQLEPC
jgi:hypothetical protein